MKVLRLTGVFFLALLVLVGIGPFLVPITPLADTVSPEQLADPDSRFITVDGIRVHYKQYGQGQPTFLLLHGFGASTFSWREVTGPLSQGGTVIMYDRPAFGLTERPLPGSWQGQNPYSPEAQVDLLFGLMDALHVDRAVLVGNSAGGTVAMQAALAHPERVQALILVDAAVYGSGVNPLLRALYQTPQMEHLGPLLVRSIASSGMDILNSAWHDRSRITPEITAGYRKPLRAQNWDVALFQFSRASRPTGLPQRLSEFKMPVLVITGDDDRIVPTENSLRLAKEIPGSELAVIENCGHVPQEECPEAWLAAVEGFLRKGDQ